MQDDSRAVTESAPPACISGSLGRRSCIAIDTPVARQVVDISFTLIWSHLGRLRLAISWSGLVYVTIRLAIRWSANISRIIDGVSAIMIINLVIVVVIWIYRRSPLQWRHHQAQQRPVVSSDTAEAEEPQSTTDDVRTDKRASYSQARRRDRG